MTSDIVSMSDTAVRLGRALGAPFEVVRVLGRGGFAEVYEVTDTELRRQLAVKVLRPDLPWGPRTLARFLQEARTLARLNHPHTLPIYFVGEGEGLVYYAMPFLDGGTLADLLRRDGPLGVPRTLALATRIIEALGHAHAHGIVHRDVKPENIVIEAGTGRPLLVDFGIARSLDGEGHHTEVGFVVGTPLYMSPEQALGRPDVDPRADLYAMGAVLFEMLTGRPPFVGNDSQEIVGHHLTQPVPVAAISRDDVPSWLRGIIVRCLAKRPDDRYPSAEALLEALHNEEMPAGVSLDSVGVSGFGSEPGEFGTANASAVDHAASAAAPTVQLPQAHARESGWRWAIGAFTLVLVAAGTVAAVALTRRPPTTMVIAENRLLEPVTLSIGDQALLLEPGDRTRMPVPRARRLEAHWSLVRPSARDGRLLGEVIEGTFIVTRPPAEWHTVITADHDGALRAIPLVVNETQHALRVSVISQSDSGDCGCFVTAGDSLRLGYYRLTPGTAIRVTDVTGRTARVSGFDTLAQPGGVVRVRIDSTQMQLPETKGAP